MADFDAATSILRLAIPRDDRGGGKETTPNVIKRFDDEKGPPSENTKEKHVKTMLKKKGSSVKKSKGGDKNKKPKRPLSAYNLFFRDERNKILKHGVDGDMGNANTNSCPPSTGVTVGPGSYVKSGIEEADNGKRARMFIAQQQQTNQVGSRRPPRFDEMAKIIGERWKNLRDTDPDRLATYKKLADAEMDRYRVALKEFNEAKEKAQKGDVSPRDGDDSNDAVENGGGTSSAKVEPVEMIPQDVVRATSTSAHPAPSASVPQRSTARRVVNTAAPPPLSTPPSSSKTTGVRRLPQNRSVAFNPPPPLPLGGGGRVAPLTKPLPSQHFHRFAPRPKAVAPPSGPKVGYADGYASTNSATKRTRGGELNSCEHQGMTVERRGSSMSCTYEPKIQDALHQAVVERRGSSMSCNNTSYESTAEQAAAVERRISRMSHPYEPRPVAPVVAAGQCPSASAAPQAQPPSSSTTDAAFRHILEEENRRLAAQNEIMVAALVRAEEDRRRQEKQVAALASAVALSGRGGTGVDPLSVLLAQSGMERSDHGVPPASTTSPPSLPKSAEELLSMISASPSSQYHQSLMESALGSLLNRRP